MPAAASGWMGPRRDSRAGNTEASPLRRTLTRASGVLSPAAADTGGRKPCDSAAHP